MNRNLFPGIVLLAVLGAGGAAKAKDDATAKPGVKNSRVFELRTYHAAPGKLEALHARFRDHTNALFRKHGMTIIGFWTPRAEPAAQNTLIYLLAFPSQEAAKASWNAFQNDPEWKNARAESERNGKLVEKVESVYMTPTDYSPIK